MGREDEGRRRVAKYRSEIEDLLAAAGPGIADGCGQLVGTVHLGHVTKVHLGLSSKTEGSEATAPDVSWPIYKPQFLLTSFRASTNRLLAGGRLRFGEVAVYFADGATNYMTLTARFMPGEEGQLDAFLGGGPNGSDEEDPPAAA